MNVLKEIWRGKDLYRIFMNKECVHHSIWGTVLDVGSGKTKASYHRFLRQAPGTQVEYLDLGFESGTGENGVIASPDVPSGRGNPLTQEPPNKLRFGEGRYIDLEKDVLSQNEASVDSVLLFNVLEHIYDYQHLLAEIKRVLKPGGQLIGAVPFLVAYHPDPHDYWRYTKEALEKIFLAAGFSNIQIKSFGYGPGVAGLSQMEQALPRLIKLLLIPKTFLFDWLVIKFRPKMNKDKFSLGLFFTAKK